MIEAVHINIQRVDRFKQKQQVESISLYINNYNYISQLQLWSVHHYDVKVIFRHIPVMGNAVMGSARWTNAWFLLCLNFIHFGN